MLQYFSLFYYMRRDKIKDYVYEAKKDKDRTTNISYVYRS